MTIHEFMRELHEIGPMFKAASKYVPQPDSGPIFGWYEDNGKIRLKTSIGEFCPITSVAFARVPARDERDNAIYWTTAQWRDCAKELGLSESDASYIVAAADDIASPLILRFRLKQAIKGSWLWW